MTAPLQTYNMSPNYSYISLLMDPFVTYIPLQNASVACYRWGQGPVPIIALHGYGEDARTFAAWAPYLPPGYSLMAPDLPHHGHTSWPAGHDFSVSQLRTLIEAMTGKEGSPFILCGYSMGGRLSLAFYQQYPTLVSKLVLLAPDGLTVHFWYWLATQTGPGNRLFQFTMAHPVWFMYGVRFLDGLRWLNKGIVKYIRRHLTEPSQRQDLFTIWTCLRRFKPKPRLLQKQLAAHQTPVRLIVGKHDRIIPPALCYRFEKKSPGQCVVREMPTGHQLLTPVFSEACVEIVTGN
jgi:pimeloyl-ACP methyl ester carboxylesterase